MKQISLKMVATTAAMMMCLSAEANRWSRTIALLSLCGLRNWCWPIPSGKRLEEQV